MFYLLFNNLKTRTEFINYLKQNDILSVFHYIPLHNSPAGEQYGRYVGDMSVTNKISDTLVRLPMFYDINIEELNKVIQISKNFLKKI